MLEKASLAQAPRLRKCQTDQLPPAAPGAIPEAELEAELEAVAWP